MNMEFLSFPVQPARGKRLFSMRLHLHFMIPEVERIGKSRCFCAVILRMNQLIRKSNLNLKYAVAFTVFGGSLVMTVQVQSASFLRLPMGSLYPLLKSFK